MASCECKGTGLIKTSDGNQVYCPKHSIRRSWPRLTANGDTEFIWLDTGEVIGHEKKRGQPRVEYVNQPECKHEFDVYNHGEVECRKCHRRYPLSWALDRIAKDNIGI